MKKLIAIVLSLILILSFAACGKKADGKIVKVGASITPHAEILREAAKLLEKEGITLDIVEYTDYVWTPTTSSTPPTSTPSTPRTRPIWCPWAPSTMSPSAFTRAR